MDTIYALSSAPGKAGVAVIRVSGPASFNCCAALCGDVPVARQAVLRRLKGRDGAVIDEALVICFLPGHSFTGEQSVEFQTHGSPAVVAAVLAELGEMTGCRSAEAGEFARRALENGRLDLAQIEGLGDLIEAETEAQRQQAMRVFAGDLGKKCATWRRDLIRAAALLAATIDFADEDVPEDVSSEVSALLSGVLAGLRREIGGIGISERIRSGFEVAILGAPNVGKSTLLNALAGRQAAITSSVAGTTRDVIEVRMDLGGLPVTFLDTAGLRDTSDAVESIGVARARERAAAADLRVVLSEDGQVPDVPLGEDDIVLRAKADSGQVGPGAISGRTGAGVPELLAQLIGVLSGRAAGAGLATRARHRAAMIRGAEALERALDLVPEGACVVDLAAEEVHGAVRALDSLVGRVDVDALLDEIFASFCLGK